MLLFKEEFVSLLNRVIVLDAYCFKHQTNLLSRSTCGTLAEEDKPFTRANYLGHLSLANPLNLLDEIPYPYMISAIYFTSRKDVVLSGK